MEALSNLLRDVAASGPWGITLIVVLGVSLLALIGLAVFSAADSLGIPRVRGTGIVRNKAYSPESEECDITFNAALKMPVPETRHEDAEWSLTVEVLGLSFTRLVSPEAYAKVKVGQHIDVEYALGRYSRALYLKDLYI